MSLCTPIHPKIAKGHSAALKITLKAICEAVRPLDRGWSALGSDFKPHWSQAAGFWVLGTTRGARSRLGWLQRQAKGKARALIADFLKTPSTQKTKF